MENDQFNQTPAQKLSAASDSLTELLEGLSRAVKNFQEESSPENFARIVSAVGAYGISGAKVWQDVTNLTRKYPVRAAIGAGLLFFALKGLLNTPMPQGHKQIYH